MFGGMVKEIGEAFNSLRKIYDDQFLLGKMFTTKRRINAGLLNFFICLKAKNIRMKKAKYPKAALNRAALD